MSGFRDEASVIGARAWRDHLGGPTGTYGRCHWEEVDVLLRALDWERLLNKERIELARSEDAIANAERDLLLSIVRDLAALECPIETIVSVVTGDSDGLCPTCHATLRSDCLEVEPHEDDCVWSRARAYLASLEAQ